MRRGLFVQPFKDVAARKIRLSAFRASCRPFSSSCRCLQDVNTAPEGPKGVPLAFELGGISISNTERPSTLAQRLGTRLAKKSSASSAVGDTAKDQERTSDQTRVSPHIPISRTPRSRATFEAQDRRGEPRGPARRKDHRGPRDQRSNNGQKQFAQSRQRNEREGSRSATGDSRRQGQGQRQRNGDTSMNTRARPRNDGMASLYDARKGKRVDDPELNDYPYEDWNNPPVRKYDEDGLLKLAGEHAQISPVARPILPNLGMVSKAMAKSSAARTTMSTTTSTTVDNSLQVLSYADRALPPTGHDAVTPDSRAESIIDNANLALSRVKELDMPRRRDALHIVEKLANTSTGGAASHNKATTST